MYTPVHVCHKALPDSVETRGVEFKALPAPTSRLLLPCPQTIDLLPAPPRYMQLVVLPHVTKMIATPVATDASRMTLVLYNFTQTATDRSNQSTITKSTSGLTIPHLSRSFILYTCLVVV